MRYTIYKKSNGEIVSQFGGSQELLELNLNSATQDYIEGNFLREEFYIEDGQPVAISAQPQTWYDFDYDTKQWLLNQDRLVLAISDRRQKLLASSDWTQLPDVTLANKAAWATYRQALRDIPEQSGYPTEIIWPTPPQ